MLKQKEEIKTYIQINKYSRKLFKNKLGKKTYYKILKDYHNKILSYLIYNMNSSKIVINKIIS